METAGTHADSYLFFLGNPSLTKLISSHYSFFYAHRNLRARKHSLADIIKITKYYCSAKYKD